MKQIQLSINDETGQLVETISATFAPADFILLRSFVDLMSRVHTCTLLQRGMPAIGNIKWESGSGVTLTSEPYSNAELHELLHVLRPVILQKEAASFHKVSALLGRRFSNKSFAAHVNRLRTVFEHGELSMYMQISIGEQPLFDKSLLNLWLNGEQYHTDAEKAADWQALEMSLTTENARALVINQLQSKVKALANLEYIVNLALKKSEENA
jgi:hypothetical protein